jgi:TolA-binding protein
MNELADRLAVTTPKGMDKMIKGLPKQAQAVVTTLQQQLSQATNKIQELEMDLKHGLTKSLHQDSTKLAIANLNDDTKRQDTHTNAFVKVEDTHTKAQTAISVAEIKEAGSMLNTHVEAAHNRVAAQDAFAAAEKAEKSAPA